jgi:uncharacterized membrane protein
MNKNILKSIGAVLAGFLTVFILSVATDALLEYIGVLPAQAEGLFDMKLLLLALAYRSLYAVLGGYITARLAPTNPMKYVAALGVLGTIGGIVGIFVGWNMSDHWYPIALAATAFPLVWVGGMFGAK